MGKKRLCMGVNCLVVAAALLLFYAAPALADDGQASYDFSGVGENVSYTANHQDAAPWKGWFGIFTKNTGTIPWTDFHFQIKNVGYDVSSVNFIEGIIGGVNYNPTMMINGINYAIDSWHIDNSDPEAKMDLLFTSHKIYPNDIAMIQVYTDNTAQNVPMFGVCSYPTPEPTTLLLMLGGMAWVARKRK
jgi:hypothetical protein